MNIKTMVMAGILSSVAIWPTVAAESGQGTFGYEEMKQGLFTPRTVQGVRSLNDGEHYTTMSDSRILAFSYQTGEQTDVFFESKGQLPELKF